MVCYLFFRKKGREGIEGCMTKETIKTFNLEDRLIDFAVRIIGTAESLPKTRIPYFDIRYSIFCGSAVRFYLVLRFAFTLFSGSLFYKSL